jgi:GTP-binding protein YchF
VSLELGIVGLPNVGKSTLFNALASAEVACSNYPFCTIHENVGVVPVPDERLERLGELLQPEKLTPATIRFVDIAGLVKGASKGEGLGNRFLASIREVDALVHLVRCFESATVSHVEGTLDPKRDLDILRTELILSDLEMAEKSVKKIRKDVSRGDEKARAGLASLEKAIEGLERGVDIRKLELSEKERHEIAGYRFLTALDSIYVANMAENDLGEGERRWVELLSAASGEPQWKVLAVSCKLESELASLSSEDRIEVTAGLDLPETGLPRLIRASYRLLGLVTFFTIKGTEVRAWTIEDGMAVAEAAGKIHTDMEKGFIRAEVVSYDDLIVAGSMHVAKEHGHVRTEGRDHPVHDGDVVLIHFH